MLLWYDVPFSNFVLICLIWWIHKYLFILAYEEIGTGNANVDLNAEENNVRYYKYNKND